MHPPPSPASRNDVDDASTHRDQAAAGAGAGRQSPPRHSVPDGPPSPARHPRVQGLAATLGLSLVLLAAGGCVAARTPDRSTSTRPEPTLDRGFSSPGVAPARPGFTGDPVGDFPPGGRSLDGPTSSTSQPAGGP